MVEAIRDWRKPWRVSIRWVRAHAVGLVRGSAVVVVLGVTLVSGYLCHGLVGPPG